MLEPGRVLRPQDLGVLSSIGQGEARVVRRPRVRLAVTGNELLPSGSLPSGFHIADANGPMLSAFIERDGGLVDFPGLVRDDRDAILEALHRDADIVIVSGGSSVGIEDRHRCLSRNRASWRSTASPCDPAVQLDLAASGIASSFLFLQSRVESLRL